MTTNEKRNQMWRQIVARVMTGYEALAPAEKQWLDQRLDRIEALQIELDRLFRTVEGEQICCRCRGDCCAKGHNHMTLANLAGFARRGQQPPAADFSATCPFLGERGCALPAAVRPYNCVSFICDKIEDAMTAPQRERFYRIEQMLRSHYQDLSKRYRAAAMTGLLIREQRCPGRSFFSDEEPLP